MSDTFFSKHSCDRCSRPLRARIMSWFTKETICLPCSSKEQEIKNKLRAKGIQDALEGCGYIPKT